VSGNTQHRIWTDCDSHGRYFAQCSCSKWYTLPKYDSNADARQAGADHLNAIRLSNRLNGDVDVRH
jgi:hypothetical protein